MPGDGFGAEDRGVEAVGLHGESDGVRDDRRRAAQLPAGPGRAREGHDVLPGDMVEQVTDEPRDQLHGTLGQDTGFDDPADEQLGQ